ncbi:MAG: hypothetical protein WCL00_10000, partial [Bacteroidota bacterium]
FRSNNFAGAGLKAILNVYKKIDLRFENYLFFPYREIVSDPLDNKPAYGPPFSTWSFLSSASLVYSTFLGPVSLGIDFFDKSPDPFTINFNFGYIIFNKRAMP